MRTLEELDQHADLMDQFAGMINQYLAQNNENINGILKSLDLSTQITGNLTETVGVLVDERDKGNDASKISVLTSTLLLLTLLLLGANILLLIRLASIL